MTVLDEPAPLYAAWAAAARASERLGTSREDAEDCASEALTALLVALRAGEEIADPAAWLVRVAKRRAVDEFRRRSRAHRRDARLARTVPPALGDATGCVDDAAEARWLAEQLTSLPPQAQAVLHGVAAGKTVSELTDELGVSRRAVESHLLRARRRLRTRWAATLAVIWGWIATRSHVRTAEAAAASTAAAVALTTVLSAVAPAAPAASAPAAHLRLRPVADGVPRVVARPVVMRRVTSVATDRRRVDSQRGAMAHVVTRPIAAVHTPAGVADVHHESRPWGHGPVRTLVGCARSLTISAEKIGC